MKILFACTNVPIPPNNGQAIRTLSILKWLASNGHAITFISFSHRESHKEATLLSDYCREVIILGVELTNLSLNRAYLRRVGCLLRRKPYSVERFRSRQMKDNIEELLTTKRFDLILCDGMYAMVNVPPTDVPILLNCHNIEHILYRRYSKIEQNLAKKYYAKIESDLMRKAELQSMERVARAMVCSHVDRDLLQDLRPHLPIWVVPNTVDTDVLIPREMAVPDGEQRPVLLFQGGLDWYPNRDAVDFFVRRVLPGVQREFPSVKFMVAGRNPPPNFVASFSKESNVEFTGTVPDMRPYLSAATVVVVPLRIGGGTRIKILEACAAGKPVVSTAIGAEGLELTPGREILLADEAETFAQKVIELLKDKSQREALARSARTIVVEKYSQQSLGKSLQDALEGLTPA